MSDKPIDLNAIEKRVNAATPGPWRVGSPRFSCTMDHGHGHGGHGQGDCEYRLVEWFDDTDHIYVDNLALGALTGGETQIAGTTDNDGGGVDRADDAAFIATAREDVPALVNAVRDRDAEIARLKARMEMSGDPTQAIMTAAQVQEIRDCEGTRSHSMEWDTCALSLADSHEAMRARLAMATEYSTPDGFTIGIANDTFDCALAGKWMVSRWDDETESPEFLAVDGTWTRYPKEEDAHETDAAAFAVLDAHRAKAPQ